MSTEHLTPPAAKGDNAFVDRLRAIPGLVRKEAAPAAKLATPAPVAPPADPFGRAAPISTPFGTFAEIPPPLARTGATGPIVRHFRALDPKIQHRTMGVVTRRPDPAA